MINKKQMWSDNPFDQWTEEELLCMKYQGICYGKGGGGSPPPPPATQTVRQSSEFPAELKPFVSDIFSKAQAVQEQRQEEGFRPELTQQLASFTPDQQAAFTGIREQVGQTRPLFEEATNLARSATRAATDPAEVADLMNPFLRNVTDIEKREAQRVADVQEQQLAAQAAQAGAFGGSRAAVLEAERQRNLAQQLGDIEARGRAAAFQDAQARLENQFAREGAGAAQLSALGAAIPAQTFKELGALSGVGAAEQQQAQRALDIATQQAREEYGFPMQTLQDFQSILRGFPLPATTNISRQTFSPAQPLATQLLGLGTGLAGLAGAAGAFRKAGGLVGAPVAMKDGGYVKLAGGGGLGQLMQGKLPSNRVRMGKVAYQDASSDRSSKVQEVLSILEKEGVDSLGKIQELYSKDIVTEALNLYTPRTQQPPTQSLEQLLTDSRKLKADADKILGKSTPGQKATDTIVSAADTTTTPSVPDPVPASRLGPRGSAANLQSFVKQKKEFPELFKKPVPQTFTPLSPEMEDFLRTTERRRGIVGKDVQDVQQYMAKKGYLTPEARGLQTIPAVSGQVPTSREALGVGVYGSGEIPQRFVTPAEGDFPASLAAPSLVSAPTAAAPTSLKDSIKSFLQKDFIGGTDYRQIERDRPSELEDPSGFFSPVRGNPNLNRFTLQRAAQKFNKGPVSYPAYGSLEQMQKAATSEPKLLSTDPIKRADQVAADYRREAGLDPDSVGADAFKEIREDLATEEFSRTTPPAQDITSAQLEETIKNLSPEGPFLDEEITAKAEQKRADAARKALTEPADDDGGAVKGGENQPLKRPTDGTNQEQVDYNAKIAEINNKDYAANIKKMLGNAPTYEKGEEPDFAARKWLALANFGAGLLASGGGKTLAQSIGEALKPALKELSDIGKEERKIKKELRQERNAQARADYQDKLQRFNLQRQLRSDDIDMFTSLARLREQQESNKISAQNAETNRNRMLSENAARKVQRLEKEFTFRLEKEGKLSYGDVDKLIDSVLKRSSKAAMVGAKDTLTNLTDPTKIEEFMSAAYQSELPFLLDRIDGRVVGKDGKTVVPRSELMKMLGMKTAPAPKGGGGNRTFQARRGQDGKLIK